MATITTGSTLFPSELAKDVFVNVNGHSALAKLSGQSPIPFAGQDTFVFSMDGEASVIGEGSAKPAGEAGVNAVTIKPVKFIYQHRVDSEFVNLSEEAQIPYLSTFAKGFAKKIARALDIAAMHGVNPADGEESDVIGSNNFDDTVTGNVVTYDSSAPDDNIDDAVSKIIDNDGVITGIAMSNSFGAALGQMKTTDGLAIYPEFRFGNNPGNFGGMAVDVNNTVSFGTSDYAIVGDFENAFKWGYASDIPMEVIEFGDPDGQGDLKRYNQVVLRAEAYIGWGILSADSFAIIKASEA